MKEPRQQFRIGRLADQLNVKRFVIRFWEKEFNIAPQRSEGGQRYYTSNDYKKFKLIKELLYEKGFTIAGAKKIIEDFHKSTTKTIEPKTLNQKNSSEKISQQIMTLQKHLIKLRELL